MDSRKGRTSTASPAKPGVFPELIKTILFLNFQKNLNLLLTQKKKMNHQKQIFPSLSMILSY